MIDGTPMAPGRLSLADVPAFCDRIRQQTEAQLRAGVAVVAVEETFTESVWQEVDGKMTEVKKRWSGTIFAVLVGNQAVEWEAERLARLQAANAAANGEAPAPPAETPPIGKDGPIDPIPPEYIPKNDAAAVDVETVSRGTTVIDLGDGPATKMITAPYLGGKTDLADEVAAMVDSARTELGAPPPETTSPPPAATSAGAEGEVSPSGPAGAPPGEGGN